MPSCDDQLFLVCSSVMTLYSKYCESTTQHVVLLSYLYFFHKSPARIMQENPKLAIGQSKPVIHALKSRLHRDKTVHRNPSRCENSAQTRGTKKDLRFRRNTNSSGYFGILRIPSLLSTVIIPANKIAAASVAPATVRNTIS